MLGVAARHDVRRLSAGADLIDARRAHGPRRYWSASANRYGRPVAGTDAIEWVVLTMGDRPAALERALSSLEGAAALVVVNAADSVPVGVPDGCGLDIVGRNLGVPGGRDRGLRTTTAEIVGFLDDDATLAPAASARIAGAFEADPTLGAVSLRLVDEDGATARRHVPRRGAGGADESGEVATFLGGASAIRREAYEEAGGYFTDLHYGHEELELSWRLIDRGWSIRYLADVEVFHPKTDISRHADGWRLTGRNRVWIARRSLPWPVAIVHVLAWLGLGARRAPSGCRSSYLRGWLSGWRGDVDRSPISWATVRRLGRLGRLPIF